MTAGDHLLPAQPSDPSASVESALWLLPLHSGQTKEQSIASHRPSSARATITRSEHIWRKRKEALHHLAGHLLPWTTTNRAPLRDRRIQVLHHQIRAPQAVSPLHARHVARFDAIAKPAATGPHRLLHFTGSRTQHWR
ncbi:hypothetical protein COCNU_01G015960 [Cocos nucifera]|uniref:Uncharacterized protein n=1 Tax=Cocos nucifera TaxID=13894 RepID=A0A8K0HVX5_COCNU|nr:hypothetical protein COCNU_01G015960 [Cocos nucifera]